MGYLDVTDSLLTIATEGNFNLIIIYSTCAMCVCVERNLYHIKSILR